MSTRAHLLTSIALALTGWAACDPGDAGDDGATSSDCGSSCRGSGGSATADHHEGAEGAEANVKCEGANACKGQGWVQSASAADCAKAGGAPA